MKRLFCVLFVLVVLLTALVPVTAQAAEGTSWIELLETGTVGNTGQNWFNYTTSATVSVPTPRNMRCTKIDMLIAFTAGMAPTKVQLRYNGTLYSLTIAQIDSSTARIYGDIPDNYYADMVLVFTRGSTSKCYTEILSCRVTPVASQSYTLSGQVNLAGTYYSLGQHLPVGGVTGIHTTDRYLAYAITYDWPKYDSITFFGSVNDLSLESIRVNLGTEEVPFTVNYIDVENGGGWAKWIEKHSDTTSQTTGDGYYVSGYGQYLYSVTVDLSNVDRTKASNMLQVAFTGQYDDMYGGTFNCQSIIGSIVIPDTSGASWWSKITAFFTGLLGRDSPEADEFASDMESQSQQMQDAVDQMDQVTKPDVEDVDVSLDEFMTDDSMGAVNQVFGSIFDNQIVVSMLLICLTCAFASYALFGKK